VRDPLAPPEVPRRLLMGSGPSNPEVRVLLALATAPLAVDDPAFDQVRKDVTELCRAIFQAPDASLGLAVPGASRAGLEAAITSIVRPGDRVLVGVYGHFGELLCTLAARHGGVVERVDAEWGQPVAPELMAAQIRDHPPRLAAIVHADTSTGVLQPLQAIGAACRETSTLLLVDAVLSLGGCEVDVGGWSVDVAAAGLQKCLGGPPGLALVTTSTSAQDAFSATGHSRYLDLGRISHLWRTRATLVDVDKTFSTQMVFAAREALALVHDEGLAARWQRHQRASRALRAGLDAIGLVRFGNPSHQVPMITLVEVPGGIDEAGVRQQLLEQHGIEIMAAFGPLRGRVWRIGAMGTNASLPSVVAVLSGLETVLASRGYQLPRGAAVDEAISAWGSFSLS
jgi:(S)-ureidoglycine---glyoxylate transaminase